MKLRTYILTLLILLSTGICKAFDAGTTVTLSLENPSAAAFVYSGNKDYPFVRLWADLNKYPSGSLYYRFEGFLNQDMSDPPESLNSDTGMPLINATYYKRRWWRVKVAQTEAGLDDPAQYIISDLTYLPIYTEEDICRKGVLLFREDFGGNFVSDDNVRQTPVKGLFDKSYYGGQNKYGQVLTDEYRAHTGLANADTYIILKKGYKYGSGTSAWYLQDDHTYPNDYTRGYFLEVNGAAGTEKIYATRLDGVCPGSHLTFTAYYANVVTYYYYYSKYWYTNPAFRMEVRDAEADTVIMDVHTGSVMLRMTSADYASSVPWDLFGFPFTVPEGVTSLEFAIYNDLAYGSAGSDYALDDIEIRSCDQFVVTFTSPEGACVGARYKFEHQYSGIPIPQWRYRWQYSPDKYTWTDVGTDADFQISKVQASDAGWYRLVIGEESTIAYPNCCAMSDPVYLEVVDCSAQTVDDTSCPDGTILQKETFDNERWKKLWLIDNDGTAPVYSASLTDVQPGLKYSVSALLAKQTGDKAQLRFVVVEPENERVIASLETEVIPDNIPHEVAASFVIPQWTYNIRVDIYDISGTEAHSMMLDDVTLRLCVPEIKLTTSAEALCSANPYFALITDYTDDGSLGTSLSRVFEYSADSITWTKVSNVGGNIMYVQRPQNLWEGWYRAYVSKKEWIDKPNCRAVSKPVYVPKIDGWCPLYYKMPADVASEEVCTNGTLIFREDFGGNAPSDPVTFQGTLPTMSSNYRQAKNVISYVSTGLYVVAKHGWQNNLNTSKTENLGSQWFIQDDHTYPNDYSRGYLLEVDGKGGNDAFYSTTISVCHELDLSFSAYVANVLEPGHNFARPKVRFVITDEETGDLIWEQSSGSIVPGDPPTSWLMPMITSAPWHLVGASFHVPPGVNLVRLSIYNDENAATGNDFAMDDIEIRLCTPRVMVKSINEVCLGDEYTFQPFVTEDGHFTEPFEYRWEYAADSLPFDSPDWQVVADSLKLHFDAVTKAQTGWYRLGVASEGNINNRACRAMSDPFYLHVEDCSPPVLPQLDIVSDKTVCLDSSYCFMLDTLNKTAFDEADYTYWWECSYDDQQTWSKLADGQTLCRTALTHADSCWYRIAAHYELTNVQLHVDHNITQYSEPFLLNVKDCTPPPPPPLPDAVITSEHVVCQDSAYCFEVNIRNAAAIPDTARYHYTWEFSRNSRLWGTCYEGADYCLPAVTETETGWYRIVIKYEHPAIDSSYTTPLFRLDTKSCEQPPVVPEVIIQTFDTTVCDTLLPLEWRGRTWTTDGTETYTLKDTKGNDSVQVTLTLALIHCESSEPEPKPDLCAEGKLIFREDFGGNNPSEPDVSTSEVPGMSSAYQNGGGKTMRSGTYMITKKGYRNGIQWHLQDDHTYFGDYTRGYFLEVDGKGGSTPFYSTTIDGLLAGAEMTFTAYVVNVTFAGQIPYLKENYGYTYPRLKFVLKDPVTGNELASQSTGDILPDTTKKWDVDLSESADWQLVGIRFVVPEGVTSMQMYIYNDVEAAGAGNDFALDDIEVHMCGTSVERKDTTVCDTLLPVLWRGREWDAAGMVIDTLKYREGEDSVYLYQTLVVMPCCPSIQTFRVDTTVCDTLLPFAWHFGDTVLVFEEAGEQEIHIPHTKWQTCTGTVYTLHLDTVLCERLYPIIVNKYNWVILCDNVRVAKLFPDSHPVSYAWYKNGELVAGATADDYSEKTALEGFFQLHMTLDNKKRVKSNILYINAVEAQPEQRIACYNHLGIPVDLNTPEEQLPPGIYINVYQSGDHIRAEKVLK